MQIKWQTFIEETCTKIHSKIDPRLSIQTKQQLDKSWTAPVAGYNCKQITIKKIANQMQKKRKKAYLFSLSLLSTEFYLCELRISITYLLSLQKRKAKKQKKTNKEVTHPTSSGWNCTLTKCIRAIKTTEWETKNYIKSIKIWADKTTIFVLNKVEIMKKKHISQTKEMKKKSDAKAKHTKMRENKKQKPKRWEREQKVLNSFCCIFLKMPLSSKMRWLQETMNADTTHIRKHTLSLVFSFSLSLSVCLCVCVCSSLFLSPSCLQSPFSLRCKQKEYIMKTP